MDIKSKAIGIIGLGQMGGGMAVNLAKAGYKINGYDLKPEACERLQKSGGSISQSTEALVKGCEVIITCLEGKTAIKVAETTVIPYIGKRQIYIDSSTMAAPDARRIAEAVSVQGAEFLDAPVSGGYKGAEAGALRIFVGGNQAVYETCLPLFQVAGNPEKVHYYGPAGMGQVAKVVQQLTTRWPDVARMEVMSFGIRAGLDMDQVLLALDVDPDSEDPYARLAKAIKEGQADHIGTIFSEWKYFLAEAEAQEFKMPMLEAMYNHCRGGEKRHRDVVSRDMPSVWHELMKDNPNK
jgi:3-hydroxyisobutyrate dehydrogenase-like beta-hydroxyacid dehydrogenase